MAAAVQRQINYGRELINLVITSTPYTGMAAAFVARSFITPNRATPLTLLFEGDVTSVVLTAATGAVVGGAIGAVVEYTYNAEEHKDVPGLRAEIIAGNAAVGALGAIVLPSVF